MRHVFCVIALILCLVSAAWADAAAEFSKGKNAYLYGDFRKVITYLQPLFGKDDNLPSDLEESKAHEALEMLGLSHFYLGNEVAAAEVFEKLIVVDGDRSLSPVTAPPEAIAFYDRIKVDLKEEIKRRQDAWRIRQAELAEKERDIIKIENRRNSRWVALVPFGVGQFQNDDSTWGGVFLGTELVAASLSVAFFFAAENLRQSDGFFDPRDVNQAKGYRIAQLATGGAALALMVGGVVHAWTTFKPITRTKSEVIKSKSGTRVSPTLTPNGLGVMFEF